MKPLSEQELQRQVADKIALVAHGNSFNNLDPDKRASIAYAVVEMVQFILSDRKAWGEQLLEDLKLTASKYYYTRGYGEPTILVSEWLEYLDMKIEEQRNQGEKTDEDS